MWILIISLLHSSAPHTASIEFSTQTLCEQARLDYIAKAADTYAKKIVICVKK